MAPVPKPQRILTQRHSVVVRLTHWINALAMFVMVMSGLQIFNAHPELYWGKFGANNDPAALTIGADTRAGAPHGFFRVGNRQVTTTGVLGVSSVDGHATPRAFPAWATLPSYQDLATGRHWHFFFAWVLGLNALVYLLNGLATRHIQRDLVPDRDQLTRRHLWREIVDHAKLHFPKGNEARRYNALQKVTYLLVLFGLVPLMILTGLAMSPGMDAAWPWLLHLFGGRQSARLLHFVGMSALVGFIVLHVFLVLVSGVWNEMRSMVTGRFAILVPPGAPVLVGEPAAAPLPDADADTNPVPALATPARTTP